MLKTLKAVASRFGSGEYLRLMAKRSAEAARFFDETLNLSPVKFDLTKLGSRLLLWTDEDQRVLHVISMVPGNPYRVDQPFSIKALILDQMALYLPDLINPYDKQKFLDYLVNFHNLVVDLSAGTVEPLDENDKDKVILSKARVRSPRTSLLAGIFSGRDNSYAPPIPITRPRRVA